MTTAPVFVMERVPDADDTTPWTSVCHRDDPFITIGYDAHRQTSRWQSVERKNKFEVSYYYRNSGGRMQRMQIQRCPTLEAALRVAAKFVVPYAHRTGA